MGTIVKWSGVGIVTYVSYLAAIALGGAAAIGATGISVALAVAVTVLLVGARVSVK